ncbi:MAG TPA: cytochrome c family protein [Geminicoccaceae bacterium]|nr:cytochrome c family protein [Geminicoccaceae bacterium]
MAGSLETNKVLAALLTAGVIASGSGVISRILYQPTMPEENAYVIQVAETTGDGEAAEPETPPLPVLLAAASPEDGQAGVRACATCHSFEQGGPNQIGPVLWGVVGRDIASVEGFAYSDALLGLEGEWTFERLYEFIHNPRGYAPGTKMAFAGVRNPEDLADILVYLRTLAEEPVPLPEAPEAEEPQEAAAEAQGTEEAAGGEPAGEAQTMAEEAPNPDDLVAQLQEAAPEDAAPEEAAAQEDGIGARLAAADVDRGARAARVCAACHSFDKGGANRVGPPLWDVVGRDIASLDFSYSDALAEKEGEWDYENLDAFLAGPRDWAPGTKMAFVGVRKPEDRADLILYLRSLSDDPAPLP